MSKWRCTVSGYVHEGDEPPEKCPMCGAPKNKFVLLNGAKQPHRNDVAENSATIQENSLPDESDVIVVGSGAAAFAAAITAAAKGAEVWILEKADSIGGTTARSGGAMWIPDNEHQKILGIKDNKEDAIRYMARYSYPQLFCGESPRLGLPENEYALIESYCENAGPMIQNFTKLGALRTKAEINWTGAAQVDYMDHLPENKGYRGRTIFPMNEAGETGYGSELIAQFKGWCDKNGVKIATSCEVTEILQNRQGAVTGVSVLQRGKKKIIYAKKGVIFGSGGYSHNKEMMLHFQRGPHYGGCSVSTNTGDFIAMAAPAGAKLGNMAGAFRSQSVFEAVMANPDGANNAFYIPGDSMLEVNRFGKRVMNEKRNYTDRAMQHFTWDPVRAEWTNLLLFLIYDQRTANLWAGSPPYPSQETDVPYVITENTLVDLTRAIKERLEKYAEKTGNFTLDFEFEKTLEQSIAEFNTYAKNGEDLAYGRGNYSYDKEWTTFPPTGTSSGDGAKAVWPLQNSKNITMYPFEAQGPYYAIILSAGTLDTCGGPVINKHGQVVNWRGKPMKGLYAAGNCIASPTANAYWGAGATIGPAMTFGHLAAKHLFR